MVKLGCTRECVTRRKIGERQQTSDYEEADKPDQDYAKNRLRESVVQTRYSLSSDQNTHLRHRNFSIGYKIVRLQNEP